MPTTERDRLRAALCRILDHAESTDHIRRRKHGIPVRHALKDVVPFTPTRGPNKGKPRWKDTKTGRTYAEDPRGKQKPRAAPKPKPAGKRQQALSSFQAKMAEEGRSPAEVMERAKSLTAPQLRTVAQAMGLTVAATAPKQKILQAMENHLHGRQQPAPGRRPRAAPPETPARQLYGMLAAFDAGRGPDDAAIDRFVQGMLRLGEDAQIDLGERAQLAAGEVGQPPPRTAADARRLVGAYLIRRRRDQEQAEQLRQALVAAASATPPTPAPRPSWVQRLGQAFRAALAEEVASWPWVGRTPAAAPPGEKESPAPARRAAVQRQRVRLRKALVRALTPDPDPAAADLVRRFRLRLRHAGSPVRRSRWTLQGEGPRGGKIWVNEHGTEYHGPNPPDAGTGGERGPAADEPAASRPPSGADATPAATAASTAAASLRQRVEEHRRHLAAAKEDYRQHGVKAKAFKAWFGDWENPQAVKRGLVSRVIDWITGRPKITFALNTSQVVDEHGKPKMVFHGTKTPFNWFDPGKQDEHSLHGPGFYFTEDGEIASEYAMGQPLRGTVVEHENKPNVMRVYLNIRNPFDINAWLRNAAENPGYAKIPLSLIDDIKGGKRKAVEHLKKLGFDGMTHIGGGILGKKKHRVWIAFDPGQVKGVANRGTFDPQSHRIDRARPGQPIRGRGDA